MMKVLWLCGLPYQVQTDALGDRSYGASAAWSWIISHLPPPPNIELHIACLWHGGSDYETFQHLGVTWHLVPTDSKYRTITLFRKDRKMLRPLVNKIRPDVVHGWGTEDSYGLLACLLSPKNHVVSVQGLIREYRKVVPQSMNKRSLITQRIEKFTLARAAKVIVESSYSERISKPLIAKGKTWLIDHPLRSEFLNGECSDGLSKNIVFVGVLNERKGISDAIKAFASANDSLWKFTIIGNGSVSYVSSLKESADCLGILDRLHFIPKASTPEIVDIYRNSSIFLLPTKIDTGPTALKEALSMGVWPLCYDNSGPSGYIRDYNFGSLATDGDVQHLSLILKECIQNKPWKTIPDRTSFIENIRTNFCKKLVWQKLIEVYKR